MTAKIDATNINGQTALHVACLNAKEDVVRILLKAGANAYSRNLHNCCPSHLAAKVSKFHGPVKNFSQAELKYQYC